MSDIGFPIDASPDLDNLASLFFEHFHAIALHALKVDVAQSQTQPAQRQRLSVGWKLVPGVPTQEIQQAWVEAVVGPHDRPIVAGWATAPCWQPHHKYQDRSHISSRLRPTKALSVT